MELGRYQYQLLKIGNVRGKDAQLIYIIPTQLLMLLDKVSIHAFVQNNNLVTENGKPLDFKTHRYLFDIYRDHSPLLCCIKAGQIGFSTMAIIKTLWLAHNRNINIGYILPTSEMVEKFVGSKVNMMIQENPVLMSWVKDKDSIKQKQLGKNSIFYLGSQTDRSAIMLSLDLLVGDEYDKSPQGTLETYDSRLQHSDYKWKWIFSNPTIPDFGVDRFWALSDQKKWHITHSCSSMYVFDEDCIDYTAEMYRCPKCKEEITREEIRMGEWVATKEGKWSGYWIPLWVNPMIKASEIAEKKRDKSKEFFANFVAGTPYINPNNALSQKVLERCLKDTVNSQDPRVIIGVDTGHNIHYTLMNQQGVFYHGYCQSVAENPTPNYDPYDEIERRMNQFAGSIVVADQGGDLIGIRKLQAKYPGRVFLCWFVKETRNQQIIRWGENEEYGKVLVDRNRAVQMCVDEVTDQRFVFNGTQEEWQPYFNHWLNIYRVKEIQGQDENDPQYGWRWVWKRKGPDHWMMSTVYARVGMDKYSQASAMIIGDTGLEDIPYGRIFDDRNLF